MVQIPSLKQRNGQQVASAEVLQVSGELQAIYRDPKEAFMPDSDNRSIQNEALKKLD